MQHLVQRPLAVEPHQAGLIVGQLADRHQLAVVPVVVGVGERISRGVISLAPEPVTIPGVTRHHCQLRRRVWLRGAGCRHCCRRVADDWNNEERATLSTSTQAP